MEVNPTLLVTLAAIGFVVWAYRHGKLAGYKQRLEEVETRIAAQLKTKVASELAPATTPAKVATPATVAAALAPAPVTSGYIAAPAAPAAAAASVAAPLTLVETLTQAQEALANLKAS